jgi:pyruvate/2-oxoglutarate/acetoin dehydrogenase E1 component
LRGEDPVIFMMHKLLAGLRGEIGGEDDLVPFGQGVIRRPGTDVTVATYGVMVSRSVVAADQLAQEDGTEVEVIDLRTVAPLDLEIIEESVRRTRHLVVVTEAPRHAGVGAEIAAAVSESLYDVLDGPVLRVGAPHVPIPHSPTLLAVATPTVDDILRSLRAVTARRASAAQPG